jgi:hypothetical protein
MEDLIGRIAAQARIDPAVAAKAIAAILAFVRAQAPQADADALFAAMPGAAEAAEAEGSSGSSSRLLGAFGGGLLGLAGKLTGLGLGMNEMQVIGRELFAYAREKAGDETVNRLAASIPGFSQLI